MCVCVCVYESSFWWAVIHMHKHTDRQTQHTHTHTHTYLQARANEDYDILLAKRGRACSTYYRKLWDTLCVKLWTHNLCMTFQRWTKDQTLCTLFSGFLFFNIPLYARVGNLQPFARIHKSWTILVCNVVLGLMVECRSMSSVDGAYKHTHTHTHTHTSLALSLIVFLTASIII